MSEFFTGITFPMQKVTPSDDAAIRRAVLADSILSGCEINYAGSTLTMGSGLLIGCGRQFRHTAAQNFAVTGAASGYARLVIIIDTTKASTKENFAQIDAAIEYATALDGFVQLRQDDVNESGTVYQFPVCVVSLGAGGITGIVAKLGGNDVQINLPASGWAGNQQTVMILGISADYSVIVAADETDADNAEAYSDAGVHPIRKTNGTLTFACSDVPSRDLTVNVALRA